MNLSLLLPLYAFIGCVEWALALTRTIYTIRENYVVVPLTVFLETLVAMLVFKNFITTGDWLIAGCYSAGSALGSMIPMLCTKRKKKDYPHGE
jgi:hypothetical protein